jgi:uncharacterized protein involved in response to NO
MTNPSPATGRPAPYSGPAILSYGFRPFFFLAGLFAALAVPAWIYMFYSGVEPGGTLSARDWHMHEMVFGYSGAVLAGFLFTAIPNWTGRMPRTGAPLAMLVALWILGRSAMAGVGSPGPVALMAADLAFPLALLGMVAVEIIAGRNWRNLKILLPLGVFLLANLVFHLENITGVGTGTGIRLGLGVLVFLITLIGGRIVPSFTRNWLNKQAPGGVMPAAGGRFDGLCLLLTAVALLLWSAVPGLYWSGVALLAAALLNLLRLGRWQGRRCTASPLLLMLHLSFLFIPAGLSALGLAVLFPDLTGMAMGIHLLGAGAIGGMTVAVMMRAAMGHTGRALVAGRVLVTAFVLVVLSALLRAVAPVNSQAAMTLAAAAWGLGYLLFTLRLAPWLWLPKAGRRSAGKTR